MSRSSKVFIYNGLATGPLSTEDLHTLFTTSEHIFPHRYDVTLCDFNFNLDGLRTPTFVVPGGSTSVIGSRLKSSIDKIKFELGDNFNYVGICAGAFLGTTDADLFVTSHEVDRYTNTFEIPSFSGSTSSFSVGVVSDYKSSGAFYPNDTHINSTPKALMPYRVNLSLNQNSQPLSQLYIAGPVFLPVSDNASKQSPSDVLACYVNSDELTVLDRNQKAQAHKELGAIIRRKSEKDRGGVFLAATHVETCVQDSKLLKFFKSEGCRNASLRSVDYDSLVKEQKESRQIIESLLNETLNPR